MVNVKNILTRAAWTAAQSGLGYLTAEGLTEAFSLSPEWKMILTAIIATILSAAKTFVAEKLNPTA